MAKRIMVECASDSNPKIVTAGFWGYTVAQTCWRIAKEMDADGEITQAWTAKYLTRRSNADGMEKQIAEGMQHAIDAGLIESRDDGRVFVHDYYDYQTPMSGAERIKAWRERKKETQRNNQGERRYDSNDKVTERNEGVTNRNATERECNKKRNGTSTSTSTVFKEGGVGGEKSELPPEALAAADMLRESVLMFKPDHKLRGHYPDPMRRAWATDIERLHRLDRVSWERVDAVLRWLPSDGFWPRNIQSGATLRKQFDRLEADMKKPPPRGGNGKNQGGGLGTSMTEEELDQWVKDVSL